LTTDRSLANASNWLSAASSLNQGNLAGCEDLAERIGQFVAITFALPSQSEPSITGRRFPAANFQPNSGQSAMNVVERLVQRRHLACVCVAFHLLATSAIAQRESPAQRGPTLVAQQLETLPTPPPPASGDRAVPEGCPPAPTDTPLLELNVDIAPRYLPGDERAGQLVPREQLPQNCAPHLTMDIRTAEIDPSCGQMRVCDLLQLAQYCHNPLYFEERLLERYGICSCCCQPLQSAACFYGNALCLPAKMWRHCPCSCVPAHPCD
jgi:hypothetical protein